MKRVRIPIILLIMFCCLLLRTDSSGQRVPSAVTIEAAGKSPCTGFYQNANLNRFMEGSFDTVDSLKVLFVRVSFSDRDFLETAGGAYFGNELRHLMEYYHGASIGRFTLVCDLASEIIPLPMDESYYGDNDSWDLKAAEIMITVVDSLDSEYDFSRWDAFAVIHAGAGRETDFLADSPWQMWSGFIDPYEMEDLLADTLGTPGIPTDDLEAEETFYIDNLMILPEQASQDGYQFGSLGIYAYQVGKRLGMVALYDPTPAEFPDSQGIGSFELMSYGLYNALGFVPGFPCAFQRYLMGWVEPVTVNENLIVNITDINDSGPGDTILVKIPAGPSEYFLVENRQHDTNLDRRFSFTDLDADGIPDNEDILLGAEFDFYLTGTTDPSEIVEGIRYVNTGGGIKIWHVDEGIIAERLASGRRVNDTAMLKGVDLEEADGVQDMDRPGGQYAFGSFLDSFREGVNVRFSGDTNPSSMLNSVIPSGISIDRISAAGHIMSFQVSFEESVARVTIPLEGDVSGLAPVAADIAGTGDTLLIVAADGQVDGKIYVLEEPCDPSWNGPASLVASFDGASWTAPPVACDIDGDGDLEIVITSLDGRIHAVEHDGSPFVIDSDDTPGTFAVQGTVITSALEISADDDSDSEVVILSSDGSDVHMYILGVDLQHSDEHYAGPVTGHWILDAGSRPVSHPVRGIMKEEMDGFFFCGAGNGKVYLTYISIAEDTVFTAIIPESMGTLERIVTAGPETSGDSFMIVMPSSADLDRDGCDEMVIGLPGIGLVYWDPFSAGSPGGLYYDGKEEKSIHISPAVGRFPSSPALADMDGDGVIETIVRDRERLFILAGFGTVCAGWPYVLSDEVTGLEESIYSVQPLAADTDGDGRLESIFNVAGDIYVMEFSGRISEGWPARGEGDATVPFAAIRGIGGKLHIFSAGGNGELDRSGDAGLTADRYRSTVSRIDLETPDLATGGWYIYRNDSGGSGRRSIPFSADPASGRVVDGSFICYPNPVTEGIFTARIVFSGGAQVTARVLDIQGEEIFSLTKSHTWDEGTIPFEIQVPVAGISSGIYICRLEITGAVWRWSGARKFAIVK